MIKKIPAGTPSWIYRTKYLQVCIVYCKFNIPVRHTPNMQAPGEGPHQRRRMDVAKPPLESYNDTAQAT